MSSSLTTHKRSQNQQQSGTILVLVESPAKCAKIESYLGQGYKCIATFGHFRELDGLKSVDTKNNFRLSFISMSEKSKQISRIKSEIEACTGGVIITHQKV